MSQSTSLMDPPALWNSQIMQGLKLYTPLLEQTPIITPVLPALPYQVAEQVQQIVAGAPIITEFRVNTGAANSYIIFPQPVADTNTVSYVVNPANPGNLIQETVNLTLSNASLTQPIFSIPTVANTSYNVSIQAVSFNNTTDAGISYQYNSGTAVQGANLAIAPTYLPPIST